MCLDFYAMNLKIVVRVICLCRHWQKMLYVYTRVVISHTLVYLFIWM